MSSSPRKVDGVLNSLSLSSRNDARYLIDAYATVKYLEFELSILEDNDEYRFQAIWDNLQLALGGCEQLAHQALSSIDALQERVQQILADLESIAEKQP